MDIIVSCGEVKSVILPMREGNINIPVKGMDQLLVLYLRY